MLFYIRCPSCGRIIAYQLDQFYNELESIKDNPKLSSKEKIEEASRIFLKYASRICCRIRLMGLIPYHQIVIT